MALEAVGLGDAAVADFIVRAVFGDGVVEDGQRASGTLLPVRPSELVLCGVDEHEAQDGAEGAPGPESLVGGATVLDFEGGCLDDFLAVAVEHRCAGDAVGVKGVAFLRRRVGHSAGLVLKMGHGAGGVEARKLGDGVAYIGRGEAHDAALLGEIGRGRCGIFGRGRVKEG